ncbi:hypothetical protein Riv7116_5501 [Rivularia sp. PCC 7116]|uniref:hypothetical protein n=1 Tax=Rivularia sp. PCC 7116 TaxID=373994 RepID=UPI00029F358B|nr:hypothetical protein Riv7116_5501 [Rivularia sp. PCC 7116]
MYLALVPQATFIFQFSSLARKISHVGNAGYQKRIPNKLSIIGVEMNKFIKRAFLPSLLATGIFSATLIPAQPARADEDLLEDAAIGAAAGAITGIITNNDSVLTNAANGAAAGAAVNAANSGRRNKKDRNLLQDLGAGAAGGTVLGEITNRDNTVSNTINGAAAGAAIHILKGK